MHYSFKKITLVLFTILGISACVSVPKNTHTTYEKIKTGVGPEDMVLDTLATASARLIISCNDHRLGEKAPPGNFYTVDLTADKPVGSLLPRRNEPDSIRLHPHGIDLVRQKDGVFLYAVSHDDAKGKHYVIKYKVEQDYLNFIAIYHHPFMNSPNSVEALKSGGFYVSNDQGKRGNTLAVLFAAKTGSLLFCDEQGGWARVQEKIAYPNGLYITEKERYLYISTSRQHQILKYTIQQDGNLLNQEKVTKLVGGDNIRPGSNDQLLIPAHLKVFKFAGHFKDSTKNAPSVVYQLDRIAGEKKVIYANDGTQINAAATALYYKGYYYIGQVFQPFIIKVKEN